jgi:hypothetical protein
MTKARKPSIDATRHYTPSLLDRFTGWVDRLSIPGWLFYGGFAAVLIALQVLIQWNGTVGEVFGFPVVYLATIPYVLGLMHHLDTVAAASLARIRPLMTVDDRQYDRLLYQLTTLPARQTALAAALGAAFSITTLNWVPHTVKVHELHFAETALSLHFNHGLTLLIGGILGVLVYHTLHQLRVVQDVYDRCSSIDLYKLRPIYAFSTLSAQTAVSIALIIYAWYAFAPLLFDIGVAGLVLVTGFSLLTFILPLLTARRLLIEEKYRQLGLNGERQRRAVTELHRRVDAGEMSDMDALNKTMASLELEHTILYRISTWPWERDTLRAVTAALFFPVVVWLTQWVLERVLGGG